MELLKVLMFPVVGFIIGYFTNYIAVLMLFHPRNKIFGIQGLIPKRRDILAKKIGEITPEIMPPYFKKIDKIPFVGEKIMEAFRSSVKTQIDSLSLDELERITMQVFKKELRFIVWVGGILGFLIGCVQALISIYI